MNTLNIFVRVIRKYSSIPVFAVSIVLLYLFVSLGFRSVLGPVLGGSIGGFIAILLLVWRFDTEMKGGNDSAPIDYRISVIFAGIYITSIFTLYGFVSYQRPWLHYLVFGLYAGYIAYEISSSASRKRVIPQILILCFLTYWSTQLTFPAGAYAPDTVGKYLPAIQAALDTGYITGLTIYLGHLAYVTLGTVVLGVSPDMGYYLLAVLALTGTPLLLSVVNMTLPAIPNRVALFSALIFGCMSWTLSRGFFPNKLNFFYPLILLVGLAAFGLFNTSRNRLQWLSIALILSPAIIFGHQFSAGAALLFLLVIGFFTSVVVRTLKREYRIASYGSTTLFIAAYLLGIFGNPIHQDDLIGRLVGLFTSILLSTSGSSGPGGPGRYSQLGLETLFVNTSGQALLFTLAVFGAAVALRWGYWEFDFGILWMGALGVFLVVGLIFNTTDTQPQRFYSLLGLFGLNLFAGVALLSISDWKAGNATDYLVVIIIAVFVVASMISPVASFHLSPTGDKIPHNQKFYVETDLQGSGWTDTYVPSERELLIAQSSTNELPITRLSSNEVLVDESRINKGTFFTYSKYTSTTGVATKGGITLGGRVFNFLVMSPNPSTNQVYTNGMYWVYQR